MRGQAHQLTMCPVVTCRLPCLRLHMATFAFAVNLPTAITCTTPNTAGYDFTGKVETNLTASGFSVSGVACANGFAGTVTYTACSSNGPYAVGGCTGEDSPCDAGEYWDGTGVCSACATSCAAGEAFTACDGSVV